MSDPVVVPWQNRLPFACPKGCGARFLFDTIRQAAARGWPRFASRTGHRCYVPEIELIAKPSDFFAPRPRRFIRR